MEVLADRLKAVPDFAKVLGDDREPIALYPHVIDFLQKYTNENSVLEMCCRFMEGARLVVTDGPLKDYQGKIARIDRHKRLATPEIDFLAGLLG